MRNRLINTRIPVARGIALPLVLGLTVVVLSLGMAMITLSEGSLEVSSDLRQKIQSRMNAESANSVAIAYAVTRASEVFGGIGTLTDRSVGTSREGGQASIVTLTGEYAGQEIITCGQLRDLRGNRINLRIDGTGRSGDGGRTTVRADVSLYQIPIYQFGVFYQGPLEITPGPDMTVMGRIHSNTGLWLRGAANLTLEGPVTTAGQIFQWRRGSGRVFYRVKKDSAALWEATGLTNTLTAMTPSTQPPAVGGIHNVRFQQSPLVLSLGGGQPRELLSPKNDADPTSLRQQKFDWILDRLSANPQAARFVVNTGNPSRPAWIREPRVFWDRREDAWVKVWDFDLQALDACTNRDSLFYICDQFHEMDRGPAGNRDTVIKALRLINGANLDRNLTIATCGPVYIQGNFNTGLRVPSDSNSYFNAQIAADAVTVLSSDWPHSGSLERPWSDAVWSSSNEPTTGITGTATTNLRINAAVITGNRETRPSCLVAGTSESTFEGCYEGGWHNSLRFLENWTGRRVVFKGSWVTMWEARSPGLARPSGTTVFSTNYYSPPVRIWGFDPRFNDLSNMPPGAPFLATAILTNWLERQ